MKGLVWKVVVVAVVVAAVLVPAAAAKAPAVKMSLLPLQKAQLGAAGKSLALQADSGSVSNAIAAGNSFTGSTKTFKKMGRITGYALDYGVGPSGDAGVTEIRTNVDEYKTAADAKKGLAFWKKDDPKLAQLNQGGFAVANKATKVPSVGSRRFAFLASFSAANIVPLWSIDEQFTYGRYELDVTVWAGSATGATKLAPVVAKKLYKRLRQALAGKLHATPVKLPKLPPAGQAPGGPDLSTLALQPSDFSGQATVQAERYYPFVLSDYGVFMQPAGPFDLLFQDAYWYPTANEASFWSDWGTAEFLSGGGSVVDLTSVGDGAQGVLDSESGGGFGQIVFSSGQLAENIFVLGSNVQASDLQNLAQSAANYINNAGLGS